MARGSDRIEIGGIARAHGIRGEVVIVTHDPDSATLGDVETIFVDGEPRRIQQARDTQRGWLVQLEGVTTRTEAEALRGKQVSVARDALELDDDDVLLDDLVGCEARLVDGSSYGTVFAIDPDPAQDRLVIHRSTGAGTVEVLLPLVDQFVTDIDVEAGIITIDPPEGLPESKVQR